MHHIILTLSQATFVVFFFYFGWFLGFWIFCADVSVHLWRWNRVFRKVGI